MPDDQDDLLFRDTVNALDAGDVKTLTELIENHPSLLSYRCRAGEWYEQGYFAGAMLLHHVAGNPIRCPLPINIVEVARLLLAKGADPNAKTEGGSTTIGLVLTGKQPSEADVAMPLVDLLKSAGAGDDLNDPDVLSMPLLNSAPETAEALVRRGANVDVRHAAGLGRVDLVETLAAGASRDDLEAALIYACFRNQPASVRTLIRHGATGDVLVEAHKGLIARTALHEAANRGHREIVRLLLENGADTAVVEPHWGGTAAGWAHHGGHPEIVEMLRQAGVKETERTRS